MSFSDESKKRIVDNKKMLKTLTSADFAKIPGVTLMDLKAEVQRRTKLGETPWPKGYLDDPNCALFRIQLPETTSIYDLPVSKGNKCAVSRIRATDATAPSVGELLGMEDVEYCTYAIVIFGELVNKKNHVIPPRLWRIDSEGIRGAVRIEDPLITHLVNICGGVLDGRFMKESMSNSIIVFTGHISNLVV